MSQADYDQAPDTLTVRELRTGGKTLVTTLLCPKQTTHKSALKSLYRSRWHVELDLRNIKTTLGMERLSCQTPTMAIKEIWVYLLAYNLIRLMMAQAALLTDWLPRQLSFKHTLQLWIAVDSSWRMASSRDEKRMACLSSSLNSASATGPAASNPGPSSDDQNPIRCSSNPARSPERTSGNMAIPRSLSKCHSDRESFFILG